MVLTQGPTGWRFFESEVALYRTGAGRNYRDYSPIMTRAAIGSCRRASPRRTGPP